MLGALAGLRILDLTQLAPGPYCTMLLGDMGADVICVEPPPHLRPRQIRTAQTNAEATDRDLAFSPLFRNKRSIALDLKKEDGRAVLHRMVQGTDVFIEGFRPGVTRRLGADYESLRLINARLVYASLTGYGQDGPRSQDAGHDLNYIAAAGALSMIGTRDGTPAIPMSLLGDYAAGGLMAALAIALAIVARERTGEGQYVDVAMTDGVLSLMAKATGEYFARGIIPRPAEHRINGLLPHYATYECKDGRWLAVAALEPPFYRNLCVALDLPEHEDAQDAAPERRERVRADFERRFRERTRDDWIALLGDKEACVSPVLGLDEALAHPHVLARRMVEQVPHPSFGAVAQVGVVPRLGGTPGAIRRTAPRQGEHTDELLRELGYAEAERLRLFNTGAVA
jgi:crotonobetainyl-CoA:carnitine CoA-transferase CaiB-like acyl-CoA transferase